MIKKLSSWRSDQMITKKHIPKIRFKGFDESWGKSTLNEVADIYDGTHQTPHYTKSGIMFLSVENIDSLISKKCISEEDFKRDFKNFPEKNDVLMTRIGDVGTANIVTSSDPLAYYVSLALLKPKNIVPTYLKIALASDFVQRDIWRRTLHIAFPKKINKNEITKVEIFTPTLQAEQTVIGNLFQNIDKTIALQRRQYEQTQTLKKSLLGKMFPQANQSQPDIRLKSFSGDWVEYRLGDITNLINGRAYKQDELLDSGKYPVLRVGNFNTNTHWYYSDLELDDKFYVNQGDLLYTWATIFAPYLWSGNKAIYHYHIWKLDLTCSLDKLFTFHLLKAEEVSLTSNTNGSTMIHVTKGEMENKKIKIPSIEEQKAIGKLLKQLDDTLTLQTKQLKTLENLKKALLAKMFV